MPISGEWDIRCVVEGGNCPSVQYILSETDVNIRAKIIRKIIHLAQVGAQDARRPLVDTLSGVVKELVVDRQVRILFSWHQSQRLLLILNGTRKKNGDVDPKVVRKASQLQKSWNVNQEDLPLEKALRRAGLEIPSGA